MKTICLGLAFALSLAVPLASAGGPDLERQYSPQYNRCLNSGDAAKGVSVAMATCINEELTKQDRRLNVAYAAAMKVQGPKAKTALRNVQRRWIRDRDRECSANLTGGTIDMIERAGCHLERTTTRAIELERMAR